MAVTRMTPSPGAVGVFTVSAPFSVGASTLYTVTALRRFSEVIGSGIDLFTELYEPLSIDKSLSKRILKQMLISSRYSRIMVRQYWYQIRISRRTQRTIPYGIVALFWVLISGLFLPVLTFRI